MTDEEHLARLQAEYASREIEIWSEIEAADTGARVLELMQELNRLGSERDDKVFELHVGRPRSEIVGRRAL